MKKTILQKNFASLATTQSQLARKIDIPEISQRYISYIVNGQKSLSVGRIREIEKNYSYLRAGSTTIFLTL